MEARNPVDPRRKRIFATLLTGVFVTVVDASAMMVALPTLALYYGTDLPTTQWVVVGTMLTISGLLVPMGKLGDLIGRKTVYVSGFIVTTLAGLLAALSPTIGVVIAARVVTGLGAAMVQGNSMAMVAGVFGDHERGRALGLQMGLVGFGSIAGPALGGLLIDASGVRGLFGILAASAAAMAVAGHLVLQKNAEHRPAPAPFDWVGASALAVLLVTFLVTLTLGPKLGWDHGALWFTGTASVVLLSFFIAWEKRCRHPMVRLGLFRNPQFSFGTVGTVFSFMGSSSMRFLIPFHLQAVSGLSPRQVGLVLMPAAAVTIFAAPLAGRMADRFGPRRVANAGLLLGAAGIAALSLINLTTSIAGIIAGMMLVALGLAFFHAPNNTAILNSTGRDDYGVVSAFINVARNGGNVLGVAVATAIVTAVMANSGYPPVLQSSTAGIEPAALQSYVVGAGVAFQTNSALALAVLAGILIWRIRRKRPF